MNNFERYIENLTEETFIQSMILNCDGCPAYPCRDDMPEDGLDCEEELEKWCESYDD